MCQQCWSCSAGRRVNTLSVEVFELRKRKGVLRKNWGMGQREELRAGSVGLSGAASNLDGAILGNDSSILWKEACAYMDGRFYFDLDLLTRIDRMVASCRGNTSSSWNETRAMPLGC